MWERIGPICFLESGQVAVTFVTRQTPGALPRRGQPDESLPFRLHALFVDTESGQVRATREWPTASERSRLSPAPGGKLIVITPDGLLLYSPSLEQLKELDLPISREALRDAWNAIRSPRGKYLLIDYTPKRNDEQVLGRAEWRVVWVDVENLQVVQTWMERSWNFAESISDHGIVLLMGGKIGRPQGPFNWLCDPLEPYCHRASNRFLDEHTIVSLDWAGSEKWMYFVGTDGELLFSEKYPEGDVFREALSADGRRLALAVYKGKGGVAFLDISPHYVLRRVMAYDIPSRRWIYALDAKKQKIKLNPRRREFALSPDGSLLGLITEEGVLKVYRVPESATAPSSTH